MHINPKAYRKAFQAYLRKGTPIERYIKQERPTTHYIWRTRRDDKVRPSHAANNGRVFSWNDPPESMFEKRHAARLTRVAMAAMVMRVSATAVSCS